MNKESKGASATKDKPALVVYIFKRPQLKPQSASAALIDSWLIATDAQNRGLF